MRKAFTVVAVLIVVFLLLFDLHCTHMICLPIPRFL